MLLEAIVISLSLLFFDVIFESLYWWIDVILNADESSFSFFSFTYPPPSRLCFSFSPTCLESPSHKCPSFFSVFLLTSKSSSETI